MKISFRTKKVTTTSPDTKRFFNEVEEFYIEIIGSANKSLVVEDKNDTTKRWYSSTIKNMRDPKNGLIFIETEDTSLVLFSRIYCSKCYNTLQPILKWREYKKTVYLEIKSFKTIMRRQIEMVYELEDNKYILYNHNKNSDIYYENFYAYTPDEAHEMLRMLAITDILCEECNFRVSYEETIVDSYPFIGLTNGKTKFSLVIKRKELNITFNGGVTYFPIDANETIDEAVERLL